MLPIEKANNALKGYLDGSLLFNYQKEYKTIDAEKGFTGYYHLYILSDDEIKEGDWYYIPRTNSVNQCQNDPTELNLERRFGIRKVIATTDSSLEINSNFDYNQLLPNKNNFRFYLPQPSQAFVKKFVEEYNKGNAIKDVSVEYEIKSNAGLGHNEWVYLQHIVGKRYIPVKIEANIYQNTYELGKEDTFEDFELEYNLKVNPKDNTITIKKVKDSWNGKEVKQMLADFLTYCWNKNYQFNGLAHDEVADNWFEENL